MVCFLLVCVAMWRSRSWAESGSHVTSTLQPWLASCAWHAIFVMAWRLWGCACVQDGGCDNTDDVIAAFKRILVKGMQKREPVDGTDVLVVRECGNKLVEKYREKAIKVGRRREQSGRMALQPGRMERRLGLRRLCINVPRSGDRLFATVFWRAWAAPPVMS
jgi:hypothetical protein